MVPQLASSTPLRGKWLSSRYITARPARLSPVTATRAKPGDFARVHYTGTLDDGSIFDSSKGRQPLEFLIGDGRVIKGFDLAVTGLTLGQTRKQRVQPADAYGENDPKMVIGVPASQSPKGLRPGVKVQLSNGMQALVVDANEDEVKIDLNHALAGKHLTFDIELVELHPSERLQQATFGAGCFWSPELMFQRLPGVLVTEVGYSNGEADEPTYEDVCTGTTGHAEVVQVIYDQDAVTYEQLLDAFFDKHDPTTLNRQGGDAGSQYRSGIYFHTPAQQAAAKQAIERQQSRFSVPIVTEIAPVTKYSRAEEYHQQYLAKGGRNGRAQDPSKGCKDPIRCYG